MKSHRSKKRSVKHAGLRPGIETQVADLVGRLATRDDRLTVAVHVHEHRALLDPAARRAGGQHRPMVFAEEVTCLIEIHREQL